MRRTANFYQQASSGRTFIYHVVPAGAFEIGLPNDLSPEDVYKFVTELAKDDMIVAPDELDYYYNHLNAQDKKIFETLFSANNNNTTSNVTYQQ